jgi:hypothetical protein
MKLTMKQNIKPQYIPAEIMEYTLQEITYKLVNSEFLKKYFPEWLEK